MYDKRPCPLCKFILYNKEKTYIHSSFEILTEIIFFY